MENKLPFPIRAPGARASGEVERHKLFVLSSAQGQATSGAGWSGTSSHGQWCPARCGAILFSHMMWSPTGMGWWSCGAVGDTKVAELSGSLAVSLDAFQGTWMPRDAYGEGNPATVHPHCGPSQ